jgi:hypothetical protein
MSDISGFFASKLSLPILPYAKWIKVIEDNELMYSSSSSQLAELPALKILDFLRDSGCRNANADTEVLGLPLLDTSTSRALSPTLCRVPKFEDADAEKWLAFWNSVGFL